MLEGPLFGKIVRFALPLAASSMLQQLFNAADLAVVGRFASAEAMAAAGSNAPVINLIVSLFVGLSVGGNVLIASMIGSNRMKDVNRGVHTIFTTALTGGIVLVFVGILVSKPLLKLMGAPEEVLDLAVLYLRIYFLAMPAMMIYNFGSSILRSKGDSERPLYALIVSGILNVILNLVFVIGFKLHVIGVASATVISNILGAGLIIHFLTHEEEAFRLDFHKLGIDRKDLKKMVFVGLPAGVQGAIFSLSNVVIQSTVNSFGAEAIAGSAAAANFDFLSYFSINAFVQAAVTFIGQNHAAGKYDRCRRVFRITMLCGIGSSAVIVILMMLFRYPILQLFTTDPDVTGFAIERLMNAFVVHFLIATYEISGGCLRGMNYSLLPTAIAITGTCIFRIAYIVLYFPYHRSFGILFRVYPCSWILTGVGTLTAYFIVRRREMEARTKWTHSMS